MLKGFNDAIIHLEKDMADILSVLNDVNVNEVILNPYSKPDGSIEGHILVQKQNLRVCNLTKHTETCIASEILALEDVVLYKYSNNKKQILFWGKLNSKWIDSQLTIGLDTLSKISFITKSYFTVENNQPIISQTEDFKLIEYAQNLEMQTFFQNGAVVNSEDLVNQLNSHLPHSAGFKFLIKRVTTQEELQMFKGYPYKLIRSEIVKMTATKAQTIMSVLASISGKFIHEKHPYLECRIPKYGHRFSGVIPPASNYPAFCIRKHAHRIYTLDEFVAQGVLDESSCKTIRSWIRRKFNILIAGGTSSGKTTLANALLHEITQQFLDVRMLIIEDVPELQFCTSRSISFTTGEFFSMQDALRTSLRFKPERIIMGEIRGAEAYTLLRAWNTGHPGGVATIHANGVNEALYRFEGCVSDHPDALINRQEIGFTINAIISIENITCRETSSNGYENIVRRKVTALREIVQYDVEKNIYQDILYSHYEDIKDILSNPL